MAVHASGAARAAMVGAAIATLLGAGAAPGLAQGDDLCGVLTADELAQAIPGAYDAPAGFSGSCQWHGTSTAGDAVDVLAYELPGAASDFAAMGAEAVTLAERPAFVMEDPTMAVPSQVVAAEVGDGMIMLTLSTADASVDVKAALLDLATIAIGRAVEGNTSGPVDGAIDGTTDGTASTNTLDVCALASPDEITAALGLDVALRLDDYDLFCSYEGGQGEKHVMVYVTTQDPTDFDLMISAIGATEVDGPGDAAWWWKDAASLFARQGDLILQVAITADRQPSDADLQAMAVAVMEVLLAP